MDFSIPPEIQAKLDELDAFIEEEIAPLEREHPQFFDCRRENARTNWDADGCAARRLRSDRARSRQRRHLARDACRARWTQLGARRREALQQRAPQRDARPRLRAHVGPARRRQGHHGLPGADPIPGFEVRYFHWTFNMPTDHAEVRLTGVRVPESAMLHAEGEGLAVAQLFVHENRIRQAASGVGVAQYCIDQSVAYAKQRKTFGEPLATRQAIQFPLADLHTECEMVRGMVHRTAWHLDRKHHLEVSEQVSMANYRANRLACNAADLAMQVHGGIGYTRAKPFEHIYRHHRRYRITEGSDEIPLRTVAGHLFGFIRPG